MIMLEELYDVLEEANVSDEKARAPAQPKAVGPPRSYLPGSCVGVRAVGGIRRSLTQRAH